MRLILRLNSGHKQPVDGELIVVYVRMRLKVGRRREMKFKDLFGGDKEPEVKAKAEAKESKNASSCQKSPSIAPLGTFESHSIDTDENYARLV